MLILVGFVTTGSDPWLRLYKSTDSLLETGPQFVNHIRGS